MNDTNPQPIQDLISKSWSPHIQQSLAKSQRAIEIADDIFKLCHQHAASDNPQLLARMGSMLGDFANNLRSALNYTARVIIQNEIFPRISDKQRKKINRQLDFPWASTQEAFEKKPVCRIIKGVHIHLYKRIFRFQPFHPGNEWLEHLMILSNTDKHIVINNVTSPTASAFLRILPDGTQLKEPWFVGDYLVILAQEGPVKAELPFYYEPLGAFATPRKTWILYLAPLFEKFSLDLIDYTRTTPFKIVQILASLEPLLDDRSSSPSKK